MFFCFLMIRRPPRSTRTDTLFPYTTLFRSILSQGYGACPSIQPALGPIEIWVANIRIESATFLLGFLDVVHRNSLPIAGRRTDMRYESTRSEEHTSELQSLMRISYAVFCLKKKKKKYINNTCTHSHKT